ncbi:hypothetical protein [Aliagarivorans taiwanensis]|uniref:hypothetical protein n=1 Tax=Aliagarivorans taiwanensis TaxID=561966 RepID=UPI00047B6569|nr:hypothetical protein [Aliagarivorans taiwanensis]
MKRNRMTSGALMLLLLTGQSTAVQANERVELIDSHALVSNVATQPASGSTSPLVSTTSSEPASQAQIAIEQPKQATKVDTFSFNRYGSRALDNLYEQVPSYLDLAITFSDRVSVLPNGEIEFQVKRGSLKHNASSLIGHTLGGSIYTRENFPSSLRFENDFSLRGENVLEILDKLIAPFFDSENVESVVYINNIVELTIGSAAGN